MSNSEIVALVEELEPLGVKFTVVPRIDGSLRLNTWRMQNSWQHRDRINRVLAERIERAPEVAAQIAEWISKREAEAVSDSASD
jgi:predicted Holliday junction resolvase-like endonuclease